MAKKDVRIRTKAFVHIGDELVDIDTLTAEQRDFIGAMLQVTMLNAVYEGKAVFSVEPRPDGKEVFKVRGT